MNDALASTLPVPRRRTTTVTTLPQARQKRPVVLVLGMHRSGTSLCSHVLSALGIDMADEIAAHPTNVKGHWERRRIVDLHDRILDYFNRGFYTLLHDFTLPVAWWADPYVGEVRREIMAYLRDKMGEAPFGFKDPRTARLMPIWRQIFNELRLEPRIILCLRNPAQVARSLHVRDGFDLDIGEFRWFAYLIDCFRYTRNYEICVIEYERWFDDPTGNLTKLREFVGSTALDAELDIELAVSEIIDGQLRHDDPQRAEARQPLIRSLYDLAQRAGDDPDARVRIEHITAQYLSFDQLQRVFQRNHAELVLRLPVVEEEVTSLKTVLGDREVALAGAEGRAEAAQAEAARWSRRADELGEAVAAAERQTRERAEELRAAEERVYELRDELDVAEAQVRHRAAELEVGRDEISGLRQAIQDKERKRQEQERLASEFRTAFENRGVRGLIRWALRRNQGLGAAIRAGDRAIGTGDWTLAAQHYRRALELSPSLMPIWVQLGHALKEKGEHSGAEAAYRHALSLDEARADTHLQLAHLLKLQARWEEAADAYLRALQLDATLKEAGSELDTICARFVEEGDKARDARSWAEAVRHYRRALARRAELTPIWVQLGNALKEHGDYIEAEAAYRHAVALDPSLPDGHLQLGHLLKVRARRSQAIDAYATAVRLDPDLVAAREALHALLGYSPSEAEQAILANGESLRDIPPGDERAGRKGNGHAAPVTAEELRRQARPPAKFTAELGLAERYGALFADANLRAGNGRDVIWLGVIDWHFRIQRPQHLATHLADTGARIFYVSLAFEPADGRGRVRIIDSPHLGIFEVRLRLQSDPTESIYHGLSDAAVGELQLALDELIAVMGIRAPIVLVEHPAWHKVAFGVPGGSVVYDCLDLATGFSNAPNSLAASEAAMLAGADLVIAASRPLAEHLSDRRSSVLIRNAADVEFFAQALSIDVPRERPIIGYFGAIAEWFNIEWIESCAAAHPDWEFRLIGRTDGCDTSRAAQLSNVKFLGEKPYQELPKLLRDVAVAIIPFKLVELTRCTNPVKLYEYMAAGKAVVAAPMPEVIEATDLVYVARDARTFAACIEQALAEDGPDLRARRQAWAREHNWASRARQLAQEIDATFPLVSVIVLTYNNWEYTNACLFALRSCSDYPNLEIIVVDNASSDETRDRLRELEGQDDRLRVILSDTNLGFAGGNNIGLRAARGEYVIILNNDTVVTRGWVRDLIRPMQLDPQIGLVGPLTNNIGNEQKVKLIYRSMHDMQQMARRFVRARLRRQLEVDTLAFFCVAIRRSVLEQVGVLDEAYGLGFFEDDDYCRRARDANYKLVIADDVFVHHHLSVSYDTLGTGAAAELMVRNRAIFEARWGPWQPHRYRDEPGFG